MTFEEKISNLDISLFSGEGIDCQIHQEDMRSLLVVQNAIRNKAGKYSYLEIGSHKGCSIQSHLLDPKCENIYSIDLRPEQQPDDRTLGHVCHYENNSTKDMLDLLSNIDKEGVKKIRCFDCDASNVEIDQINPKPLMIFIDGEHTKRAVLSDFDFCYKVLAHNGAILFHDAWIVYPGIKQIISKLKKSKIIFKPVLLDGFTFMILFDIDLIKEDKNLREIYNRNYKFLKLLPIKKYIPQKLVKLGRFIQRFQYKN